MKPATKIAHCPGKDTPVCEDHLRKLVGLGAAFGIMLSWTPCEETECSNCASEEAHFQTWAVFALILALGFALGAFGTYFFFTRQVSALNSRFDHLEQMLVTPLPAPEVDLPAPADNHVPIPSLTATEQRISKSKGESRE